MYDNVESKASAKVQEGRKALENQKDVAQAKVETAKDSAAQKTEQAKDNTKSKLDQAKHEVDVKTEQAKAAGRSWWSWLTGRA